MTVEAGVSGRSVGWWGGQGRSKSVQNDAVGRWARTLYENGARGGCTGVSENGDGFMSCRPVWVVRSTGAKRRAVAARVAAVWYVSVERGRSAGSG
jgi:hypothetical protein